MFSLVTESSYFKYIDHDFLSSNSALGAFHTYARCHIRYALGVD